jgi:hypothetical protein
VIRICSRRSVLKMTSIVLPIGTVRHSTRSLPTTIDGTEFSHPPSPQSREPVANGGESPISDSFPTQLAEIAREMVTVAHYDLRRVRELVDSRPTLANAAWDWGFGDWETALGAASHMGNIPIASYLMSKGARPSIFSAAALGQLDVVKAFVAAQPGVQSIRGPHSISLLAHASAGGEPARSVLDFLKSLGDADSPSSMPLSDTDAALIAGTYLFGVGASQQIDVTIEQRQKAMSIYSPLTWTRKGSMGRPLVHVGNGMFYPAGAPSVRIKFAQGYGAMQMTVSDPDVVMITQKKFETK